MRGLGKQDFLHSEEAGQASNLVPFESDTDCSVRPEARALPPSFCMEFSSERYLILHYRYDLRRIGSAPTEFRGRR